MKVLLTNWASSANIGDHAILKSQVEFLTRSLGCSVEVLGMDDDSEVPADVQAPLVAHQPWSSPELAGLRAWVLGGLLSVAVLVHPSLAMCMPIVVRRAVDAIRRADVVMPKGGGYINADGSLRKLLFLARVLWPLFMARRLGKQRALIGHSVGPLHGRLARMLARLALEGATPVTVRDDASKRVCASLGIRARRLPDLGLFTRVDDSALRKGRDANVILIGATVKRVSKVTSEQHRYTEAVCNALTAIADIATSGGTVCRLRLFPQVIGPTSSEDDRPLIIEVAHRLEHRKSSFASIAIEADFNSIDDALQRYSEVDFLFATRMHSALLAACVQTPFFIFGYIGEKAAGLVEDLCLPTWVTTSEIGEIEARAIAAFRARDELRSRLGPGVAKARQRLVRGLLQEFASDEVIGRRVSVRSTVG